MKYVDVIVDNNTSATDSFYTYACPFDHVKVGSVVTVPFARGNRVIDGYVAHVDDSAPEGVTRIKSVTSVSEDVCLTEEAMETAIWMRGRYLCRYIEAVKCFLPGEAPAKRRTKDPFADVEEVPSAPETLTDDQKKAMDSIGESIDRRRHQMFLLFGVTGSGKTEVYLQAMQRVIDLGRQGIILVPEISLTPQTVSRFVNRFGRDRIAILHSKLTPMQKSVEYRRIESGSVSVVIGARSAIFAPLKDIGLIVLDEEHETSYKSDKSPKYDTVEVAAKRAGAHGAAVVLGSATPALADYYRSETGLFKRLELSSRYNRTPMPFVEIVDMRNEIKAGNRSLFSAKLAASIEDCLQKKKQTILFLNRRGYSSFVSCRECGYVVKCPECGISMTYHKEDGALVCHYCGRKQPVPGKCPECGSKLIGRFGAGTEQVEEKVRELFPKANTERIDLDSVRKKGSLESILKRFSQGKTDILIGTQLVAKGLDVANVGLVGIISADVTLNIPDFRSAERTFQLVTQAAGRAGRGQDRGFVVIQTYSPDHMAVETAANHDYKAFYEREIYVRERIAYPPFCDIFQIIVADEDKECAGDSAERCARWLRRKASEDTAVLGPSPAPLNKANGMFRYQLLVKSPMGCRRQSSALIQELKSVYVNGKGTAALLTTDINPYSFL